MCYYYLFASGRTSEALKTPLARRLRDGAPLDAPRRHAPRGAPSTYPAKTPSPRIVVIDTIRRPRATPYFSGFRATMSHMGVNAPVSPPSAHPIPPAWSMTWVFEVPAGTSLINSKKVRMRGMRKNMIGLN